MLIAAVDPGMRDCGVAVLNSNTQEICFAFIAKNPEAEATGPEAWERMAHAVAVELEERLAGLTLGMLVVERQYIPFGTKNPFAILGLAYVVGALVMRISAPKKIAVMASTWKGKEAKEANNARTMRRLSPEEKKHAEVDGWKGHNGKDAIAIAKWAGLRFSQQEMFD